MGIIPKFRVKIKKIWNCLGFFSKLGSSGALVPSSSQRKKLWPHHHADETAWTKYNLETTNPKNWRKKNVGVEFLSAKKTRGKSWRLQFFLLLGEGVLACLEGRNMFWWRPCMAHIFGCQCRLGTTSCIPTSQFGWQIILRLCHTLTKDLYTFKCCCKSSGLFVCT